MTTLGGYAAGMGRLGQSIYRTSSMSSYLNNQWKAIGTTFRYALAGGAIFGLTRMVGQLRDVNNQLALMSAIGSGPSGQAFTFNQITQLGNGLQDAAVNSITPINEMNDATINFLSTVQNVPRSQIPSIMEDVAKAARLAQTPVEDLTQAATTMNIAFGRENNLQNIKSFNRMWFALISTAPGGVAAAPTIAQAMPGLASMFQMAPGHQPAKLGQAQMMALTLGVLRTGMPAATAMRGLTYLIQSIAQPTGGAKTALAGIGITPEFVQSRGVFPAVMKLLHQISPVSGGQARRLGAIPEDTLDQTNALPGIPASEMARLRAMIPRIHGIRAAIILASQLQQRGAVRSITQDLQDMTQAEDDHARAAQDLNKAWQRANKRMKLQQAQVAINTMGLQVAQMFEPALNFAAKGPIGLSHLMQHHRGIATMAGRTMVGLLTGGAIARFLRVGNLPGIRRIPGMSRLFGGGMGMVPQMMAVQSALTANPGILGGSPQNPMYVSVINDLFGGGATKPGGGGGGGFHPFGWIKGAGKWVGGGGLTGLLMRGGGAIPRYAGMAGTMFAAEMPMIPDAWNWIAHGVDPTTGQRIPTHGFLNALNRTFNLGYHTDFQTARGYHHALARANRLIGGGHIENIASFKKGEFHGKVDFNLLIDQVDANGKLVRRTVHVPVDIWSGPNKHPRNRGQSGRHGRR